MGWFFRVMSWTGLTWDFATAPRRGSPRQAEQQKRRNAAAVLHVIYTEMAQTLNVWSIYTVVKVDGATPKRWRFVRGHDKPIHGSCAIYFPGGIMV